ncbi:serine hydrolase domain-containing protein [Flavilitoribacter nigricans]|nr:serine hydrolase domain-containing protein [Flavilitoribacter nigricans]
MKFLITTLLTFCFTCNILAQQDVPEKINDWLREENVPAIGIGLIKGGSLEMARVFGELEAGTPAPDQTIFNVASLTKPIVAVLTLQLVTDGQWDLDEPLARYWTDPDIADDPLTQKLTTRHVLSHQTGFKNWRRMYDDQKLAFEFEPGTKFQYSGEGYEYLRRALKNKFGKTLDQLVADHLFQAYGMEDSRLIWDADMADQPFATGHNVEGVAYETFKRENANAADDLLVSVEDYCRFVMGVMQKEGLSDAVFADMVSPQVQANDRVAFGLGWMIIPDLSDGSYALMHTGGDQGVRAIAILFPQSQDGIVLFTNGDNGVSVMAKVMGAIFEKGGEVLSVLN